MAYATSRVALNELNNMLVMEEYKKHISKKVSTIFGDWDIVSLEFLPSRNEVIATVQYYSNGMEISYPAIIGKKINTDIVNVFKLMNTLRKDKISRYFTYNITNFSYETKPNGDIIKGTAKPYRNMTDFSEYYQYFKFLEGIIKKEHGIEKIGLDHYVEFKHRTLTKRYMEVKGLLESKYTDQFEITQNFGEIGFDF